MFIVIQLLNNGYAVIADGYFHKIEKPKMKNLKHLQLTNIVVKEISDIVKTGSLLENHMIKNCLKSINE